MEGRHMNRLTAFLSRPFTGGNRVVLWTQLSWIGMAFFMYGYFQVNWKLFAEVMAFCVAIPLVYRLLHDTVWWTIFASLFLLFFLIVGPLVLCSWSVFSPAPWHFIVGFWFCMTLYAVVPLFSILYDRISKRVVLRNILLSYITAGTFYLMFWWMGVIFVPTVSMLSTMKSIIEEARQYETRSQQQLDALARLCSQSEYEFTVYTEEPDKYSLNISYSPVKDETGNSYVFGIDVRYGFEEDKLDIRSNLVSYSIP